MVQSPPDVGVPADRYGRRASAEQVRRRLLVTFGVFLAVVLAWATWVAVAKAREAVSWSDLGSRTVDATAIEVRYRVDLTPGRTAVCSVKALNRHLTVVGRAEQQVGPSGQRTLTVNTRIPTSEEAFTGSVTSCVPD